MAYFLKGENMKESTGGEEPTKIEIGVSTIMQVEKEANSIFNDVIEEKNLSEYYLKETMFKIMYLKEQLVGGLSKVQDGLIDECKKNSKKNPLIPFLAVANMFVANIAPFLGLINSIVLISIAIKSYKKQKEESERFLKLKEEMEETVAKANAILITLSNNETFALKRIKELGKRREKELTKSPKDRSLVAVANIAIQDYIDSDVLPNNLPEEIKSTIIRLLQNDLNTTESDMSVLLESAKQKVSLETLVHRME